MQRIGALAMMDDPDALVGNVSERDIVRAIARHREKARAMTAAELMRPDPLVATPETAVDAAMQMMDQSDVRCRPVMQDGKPAGSISIRDLVTYRTMQHLNDVETLASSVSRPGP